jgi:hypothetical protein
MQLSPQEAAAALAQVDDVRVTMRRIIRAHRGHYHLWIWGAAWVAMPLLAHFKGDYASHHFGWICLVGGVASAWVGFTQSAQIRMPSNLRFLGVLGALLAFGALFPFVLHARPEPKMLYAYTCLIAMQAYVIAGVWTDSYLLWLGVFVTGLVLVGFFFFPGIFWLWMAVFGGGSLIATGFYVRHFWR